MQVPILKYTNLLERLDTAARFWDPEARHKICMSTMPSKRRSSWEGQRLTLQGCLLPEFDRTPADMATLSERFIDAGHSSTVQKRCWDAEAKQNLQEHDAIQLIDPSERARLRVQW